MNDLVSKPGVAPDMDYSAPIEFDKTPLRVSVPAYLQKIYWWAYVHPNAVKVFEREWLVNLILFGNYSALRRRKNTAGGMRVWRSYAAAARAHCR